MLVDFADELFTFLPAGAAASIRADLGLSYAEAGLVLAMLSAGGFLGVFATAAADFVSRRALASAGALLYGLCMLAFAAGRSFWVFVVAAFLWGAASDAFLDAAQVALADLAGDDLDATLARANLFGAVGDLLGPVVLTVAVATGLGWRPVLAAGGLLMLGYAAVLARQPVPAPAPGGTSPWAAARAALADRRVWVLALALGLLSTLDEPFLGFVIASIEARGRSVAVATALAGSIVVGSIAGFALLAAWGERVRDRPSWSPSRAPARAGTVGGAAPAAGVLGAVAISAAAVVLVAAPAPLPVATAGVVFGAGIALVWVVLQAAVLRLRPGQAGTTEAVVSLLASFELLVPPAIGAVADAAGLDRAMWCYVAISLLLLAVLAGPSLPRWTTRSSSRSRR
jgi:FSR family fosmidomycin resistance protein-like MFS transporter